MTPILQLILQSAPAIIAQIQQAHAAANPGAPALTAEQIHQGFEDAFASTHFKDALLRAALEAEIKK